MSMLEVKDLVVSYGGIEALKGISFSVDEGQIVTLIGANGAGKSTTLRAITGLVPVKSGSIFYNGDDITRLATQKTVERGIALVPEGLLHEKAGDDAKNAGWFTIKDTEISRKNNADGTVCATHRLCLENKELAVRTESQVRVEWSPGAVLENKTYTMEHTTLLASDHSAVILEGYEYLVKRLADRP